MIEPVASGGFHGFELGVDGSHGADLCLPGGGSRNPASPAMIEQGLQWVHMNGREVFREATRLMVSSAEQLLAEVGATVDEIDLYVPHQANQRIVDHAVKHLGLAAGEGLLEHRRASATRPRRRFRSVSPTRSTRAGSSRG